MDNQSLHVVVIPHGFQEHYALGFVNGLSRKRVLVDFVLAENMDCTLLKQDIRWRNLGRNTQAGIGPFKKTSRFLTYHLRLINYVATRRRAVVHVIGLLRTPLVTGIIEGLLFRVLSSKYVLTVHNLLPHDRHTLWNMWLFKRIYRIPHLLVVHTARMKKELVTSFGVDPERVVIMQHGLNDIVPDHGKTRSECRTQLALPEDACVLLFFGRIAPYKGLDILLDALAELDDGFMLLIAGAPISSAYYDQIEVMARNHPKCERILCRLEFIENAEIATYFRAADALVMPYRHIDQSGVLFLAFRFGLPVVAFDVGALSEYVKGNAGLLVTGGACDLAKGLRAFRDARQQFGGEDGRDYSQRFKWENVVEPLIRAYGGGA